MPGTEAEKTSVSGNQDSAVDKVITAIKKGVRFGRYVPGQRLIENDLATTFQVSRGTVRDALRRLEAEGLVHFERYRGASIRKMSRRDIAELNQIRAVLEGYAAAQAARNGSEAQRASLLELERYWATEKQNLPEDYTTYNTAFHDLIVEMSGCRQLVHFIQQTNLSVFRLQFHVLLMVPQRIAMARTEHRAIVEAILARNECAANEAMRKHVDTSTQIILSAPDEYFFE